MRYLIIDFVGYIKGLSNMLVYGIPLGGSFCFKFLIYLLVVGIHYNTLSKFRSTCLSPLDIGSLGSQTDGRRTGLICLEYVFRLSAHWDTTLIESNYSWAHAKIGHLKFNSRWSAWWNKGREEQGSINCGAAKQSDTRSLSTTWPRTEGERTPLVTVYPLKHVSWPVIFWCNLKQQ